MNVIEKKDPYWYKKLSPMEVQLYKQLYKKDFYEFALEFWDTCDPAPLINDKLIKFYCEVGQYMVRKWVGYQEIEIKNIPEKNENLDVIDVRQNKDFWNINVPPRHGKTIFFSVLLFVYVWLSYPILGAAVCHGESLATEINSKRQKVINSEKFKFFFPEVVIEMNTAKMIKDSRGGELYAINRSNILGRGVDFLTNDDILNNEAARLDQKEAISCYSYFFEVMPGRINNVNKCCVLQIAQRLYPNDITGHILNDPVLSTKYCFVVLPAIFKKKTILVCPISGDLITYNAGEGLYEARFGNYEGLRAQVGERTFQAQYLQDPVASDATIVKEENLRCEDASNVPGWDLTNNCIDITKVDRVYASHDFPVKDKITSDFLGSVLAYKYKHILYIVDCEELKQNISKSIEFVKQRESIYPGITQLIEDKANGTGVMTLLRDEVPTLIPFNPGSDSKSERLSMANIYIETGKVVFVKTKMDINNKTFTFTDKMKNLIDRLISFPFVAHDDIVDSLSQLILYVFNDIKYSVYGKSFNDFNIIQNSKEEDFDNTTGFINKEGDNWKVVCIGVKYGLETKITVIKETQFVADINTGLRRLKSFMPNKNVFIDCSVGESLGNIYTDEIIIENYAEEDFEKSVLDLNYAFSQNKILIDENCKLTQTDLDNFKYDKKSAGKFVSNKDGFIACIRTAIKYYGGISY